MCNSPELITSTRERMRSWCFLAARSPFKSNILKYLNISDASPPITSINSPVSLNGEDSKPKFRGDEDSMKP